VSKYLPSNQTAETATRFESFRDRYKLSYRTLAKVLGVSRTSAFRLCKAHDAAFITNHRAQMAHNVRAFLGNELLSEVGITQELALLFDKEEEMITTRVRLTPSATKFFGLRRDPFYHDPRSAAEYFSTPELDEIADQVEDAILNHGFVAVTGEIGAGKTVLKHRVMAWAKESVDSIRVIWPEFFDMEEVTSNSMVKLILHEFDQRPRLDKLLRAAQLRQLLENRTSAGISVALAFDEAHRLSDRMLSSLKNFREFGSQTQGGFNQYLGIVLFGQPQLEGRLRDFKFTEIAQRLEIVRMPTLTKKATDYIAHRLSIVGGEINALFETDALADLVKQASTPLTLGNVINTALMEAFRLKEKKVASGMLDLGSNEPRIKAIRRR